MAAFTDDRCLWNDLEHEFAGLMTTRQRALLGATADSPVNEEYLEEYYTWILEYGRGLEQDAYVNLVWTYAPELLHIVEVSDE